MRAGSTAGSSVLRPSWAGAGALRTRRGPVPAAAITSASASSGGGSSEAEQERGEGAKARDLGGAHRVERAGREAVLEHHERAPAAPRRRGRGDGEARALPPRVATSRR